MPPTRHWHPETEFRTLGLAHRVMEDDVYNGMFIPRGSTIIINTRQVLSPYVSLPSTEVSSSCMAKDDRIYKSPHMFYPERYLPLPEGHGEPVLKAAFGFGRR